MWLTQVTNENTFTHNMKEYLSGQNKLRPWVEHTHIIIIIYVQLTSTEDHLTT